MADEGTRPGEIGNLRGRALRLLLGETNRDISIVLFGQFVRLGVGLVTSALLARSLGPEGLRIFSVIGVGITILSAIADFGLSASALRYIPRELVENPGRAFRIAGSYALLKFTAGLIFFTAAIIFAGWGAEQLLLPPEIGTLLVVLGALGSAVTCYKWCGFDHTPGIKEIYCSRCIPVDGHLIHPGPFWRSFLDPSFDC